MTDLQREFREMLAKDQAMKDLVNGAALTELLEASDTDTNTGARDGILA